MFNYELQKCKDGVGGGNLAVGVQSSRVYDYQDCLHVSNTLSYWTPCMTRCEFLADYDIKNRYV